MIPFASPIPEEGSSDLGTLQNEVSSLRKEIHKMKQELGSPDTLGLEQKKEFNLLNQDNLVDSLWDKFLLLSEITVFTVTSATTTENIERHRFTAAVSELNPGKSGRFRCSFYFGSTGLGENAQAYITSFHTRTSTTAPVAINEGVNEYIGIKIVDNAVSLVTYSNSIETLYSTSKVLEGNTTYTLEIFFDPSGQATFLLDKENIGVIRTGINLTVDAPIYYPIFCSIKSLDGVSHSLNIEYFQFLQERKQ